MSSILKVSEIQDPTNGNTALSIDSSGRVSVGKPIVVYAINDSTTYTAAGIIVWNNKFVDTANAYNESTGVFTAPKAGLYEVNYHFLHRGTGAVRTEVRKNSSYIWGNGSKSQIYQDGVSGAELTAFATAIIDCAVNDTLDVYIANIDSGTDVYGNSNAHNGFTVKFLG